MFNCSCDYGFTGIQCETDINFCVSSPCRNGRCTDGVNAYSCLCHDGFTGSDCAIEIDECLSNPCLFGACNDEANSYSCSCISGYTGPKCRSLIDDCYALECADGECFANLSSYYCIHEAETVDLVDDCASNPCVHGSCTDFIDYYTCTCDSEVYYGLECDRTRGLSTFLVVFSSLSSYYHVYHTVYNKNKDLIDITVHRNKPVHRSYKSGKKSHYLLKCCCYIR